MILACPGGSQFNRELMNAGRYIETVFFQDPACVLLGHWESLPMKTALIYRALLKPQSGKLTSGLKPQSINTTVQHPDQKMRPVNNLGLHKK